MVDDPAVTVDGFTYGWVGGSGVAKITHHTTLGSVQELRKQCKLKRVEEGGSEGANVMHHAFKKKRGGISMLF